MIMIPFFYFAFVSFDLELVDFVSFDFVDLDLDSFDFVVEDFESLDLLLLLEPEFPFERQ